MNQTSTSTYHSYEQPHSNEGLVVESRRHTLYQSVQYLNAIAVHVDAGLWVEEQKAAETPSQATAAMELREAPVEMSPGIAGNLAMNGAQPRPQTSTATEAVIGQVSQEQHVAEALRAVEDAHQTSRGVLF